MLEHRSAARAGLAGPAADLPESASGGVHFAGLDGLRAVAALAVLVTHVGFQTGHSLSGFLGAATARLDIGVTIFFLLSGFLLYRPFALAHLGGTAGPRVGRFYARRALRILPAYWVALGLAVVIVGRQFLDTPAEWLRQVFLVQVYPPGELLIGTNHTWSLCTEVAFYAVLPVYAFLVRPRRDHGQGRQVRRELVVLLVLALSALVWPVAYEHGSVSPYTGPLWLPAHLDWFALGMACAVLSANMQVTTKRPRWINELASAPGTCWVLALALFWLATTPLTGPRGLVARTWQEEVARHILYGAVALCILLPAVLPVDRSNLARRVLDGRVMRHLGRISYGLFLYQLIALDLVYRWTDFERFSGNFAVVTLAVTALTVAMAEVSWHVVEAPALRLKPAARPSEVQRQLAPTTGHRE